MSTDRATGVLLLASAPPSLGARSGYTRVAEYVEGAQLIETPRLPDRNVFQKGIRTLLKRKAITSWYQFSSAQLELRAWKRMRSGFRGVVHVLWADSDLGYMDLLCRREGVPLCCTFHGCVEDLPEVIQYPARLRKLGAVIVVSKTQVDYFLAQGVPAEKVIFIPHGIDTEYYSPADADAAASVFTVLSVGSYRRNFDLLRQVCDRFKDDRRFQFEIISSPRFKSTFDGLPNVRFRSGVPDEELVAAYRRASCLLMTVQASTANNAVLEALACGVPIVAERVGGISEYLSADCALETAPHDVEGLLHALELIQGNPDLRRKMATAARRRAGCFSWEAVAKRTDDVYHSLKDAIPA